MPASVAHAASSQHNTQRKALSVLLPIQEHTDTDFWLALILQSAAFSSIPFILLPG